MSRPKVDRELTRQLSEAGCEEPVAAAFSLAPGPKWPLLSPEEVEVRVSDLLAKVHEEVGSGHRQCRVYKNIGHFTVTAVPAFIRTLSEQAEIATATAASQPEFLLIKPVSSRRATESSPDRSGAS